MIYDGLRDWLDKVDALGELTTLESIDWNLEMGAIVDVLYREHPPYAPALIFDNIKDHRPAIARCSAISLRRSASRSPSASPRNSITCWNSPAFIMSA